MGKPSDAIDRLLDHRRFAEARKLIVSQLRRTPANHWLLTRLSWVAACQDRGREALRLSKRALRLMPTCPLALWDYAGALHAVNRPGDANPVYRRLIRRGVRGLAMDPCGEGLRRSRGLVADCHFQLALRAVELRRRAEAKHHVALALKHHRLPCEGVDSIADVRQLAKIVDRMKKA